MTAPTLRRRSGTLDSLRGLTLVQHDRLSRSAGIWCISTGPAVGLV